MSIESQSNVIFIGKFNRFSALPSPLPPATTSPSVAPNLHLIIWLLFLWAMRIESQCIVISWGRFNLFNVLPFSLSNSNHVLTNSSVNTNFVPAIFYSGSETFTFWCSILIIFVTHVRYSNSNIELSFSLIFFICYLFSFKSLPFKFITEEMYLH